MKDAMVPKKVAGGNKRLTVVGSQAVEIHAMNELEVIREAGVILPFIQKNIRNFGFKTLPGQVDKVPKTNQDAYIVFPSLDEDKTIHLFAVADGHGRYNIN